MNIFKVILHNGLEFPYTVKEGKDKNTKLFSTFDTAWNASKLFANTAEDFTIVRYKILDIEIIRWLEDGDTFDSVCKEYAELTPTQSERVRKLKLLFDNVNQRRRDK